MAVDCGVEGDILGSMLSVEGNNATFKSEAKMLN